MTRITMIIAFVAMFVGEAYAQRPFIAEAFVTVGTTNPSCLNQPVDTVTIKGSKFDLGDPPVVSLGLQGKLTVCSADTTTIVAELPDALNFLSRYLCTGVFVAALGAALAKESQVR